MCSTFAAHVGNDFVDVALAIVLQLHGEVAAIGFGDGGQSQLQSGAPRSVFDFRHGAQNLLDVQQDAIGFGERASRRSEVVQNEAAFIHFREQVGSQKV